MARSPLFDFSSPFEVVAFGRVGRRPPKVQVCVEVLLKPARGAKDVFPAWAEDAPSTVRWVPVGEMGGVSIGQRWQNGVCIGRRSTNRVAAARVRLRPDPTEGPLTSVCPLDPAIGPTDGGRFKVGQMTCLALDIVQDDSTLREAFVPVMEFVRVLFGVSSHFLIQLFHGTRDPSIARDSPFFMCEASRRIDADTYRLACARVPEDMEAIVAAYACADDDMRRTHDSVHARLQNALVPRGSPAAPIIKPPVFATDPLWHYEWEDVVTTELDDTQQPEGRRRKTRRLLTRLLRIDVVPPFKRVEIKVYRSGGAKSADETLPPRIGRASRADAPVRRLVHDRPPGSFHAGLHEFQEGAYLRTPDRVEVVMLDNPNGAAAPGAIPIYGCDGETIDVSTADRSGGGDSLVAHLKISRYRKALVESDAAENERRASLENTTEALRRLVAVHGWSCVSSIPSTGLPPLVSVFDGDVVFEVLRFVMADRHGRHLVVIDAGTTAADPRAMGLVARSDGRALSARELASLSSFTARERAHWQRRTLTGYAIASVLRRHAQVTDLVAHEAKRIAAAAERLFRPSGFQGDT